jgi:hypothetical protein
LSRRPARCTEADIKRAVKAAGPGMCVDILPDGTIRIAPFEAIRPMPEPKLAPKARIALI